LNDEEPVITMPLPTSRINYAGTGNLTKTPFNNQIAANIGTVQSIEPAKTLLAEDAKPISSPNHIRSIIISLAILLILAGFGVNRLRSISQSANGSPAKETTKSTTLSEQQNAEKKPLLLSYSLSLSEPDGKGRYKPPIQIANQEIIYHNGDSIKFNLASAK